MKLSLATLLIFSIAFLAIFGVSAIHLGKGSHGSCIASATRGVGCPSETDFLAFLNFHIGAFKGLIAPTVTAISLIFAPLLSTLLVIAMSNHGISPFFSLSSIPSSHAAYSPSLSLYRPSLIHWLAFQKHSPPLL